MRRLELERYNDRAMVFAELSSVCVAGETRLVECLVSIRLAFRSRSEKKLTQRGGSQGPRWSNIFEWWV
jgi:hypothetical protein